MSRIVEHMQLCTRQHRAWTFVQHIMSRNCFCRLHGLLNEFAGFQSQFRSASVTDCGYRSAVIPPNVACSTSVCHANRILSFSGVWYLRAHSEELVVAHMSLNECAFQDLDNLGLQDNDEQRRPRQYLDDHQGHSSDQLELLRCHRGVQHMKFAAWNGFSRTSASGHVGEGVGLLETILDIWYRMSTESIFGPSMAM